MRTLKRNKQKILYSNYEGKTEKVDGNGNYTGEKILNYGSIQEADVNVSPSKGEASVEMFGTDENYSNTIVTDKDYGWNENTRMWVGDATKNPLYPSDTLYPSDNLYPNNISKPHNYTVVAVAKSINNNAYAIRKVDVSGAN